MSYPITIGKLLTSQTNSTSTTIFFIIHSYSINTCNLQPAIQNQEPGLFSRSLLYLPKPYNSLANGVMEK